MISFDDLKLSVKQHKFDFTKVALALSSPDESFTSDNVRIAYSTRSTLGKTTPTLPPPTPTPTTTSTSTATSSTSSSILLSSTSSHLPIEFSFDVETELTKADYEMTQTINAAITTKSNTPQLQAPKWSYDEWNKDQEQEALKHRTRTNAAFDRALSALGGTPGSGSNFDFDNVDLRNFPPDIVNAIKERRDNEKISAMEKRQREEQYQLKTELNLQRERLKRRFDVDSEDRAGVDPFSSSSSSLKPSIEDNDVSALGTNLLSPLVSSLLDNALDSLEADTDAATTASSSNSRSDSDSESGQKDSSDLAWVLKYLDDNPSTVPTLPSLPIRRVNANGNPSNSNSSTSDSTSVNLVYPPIPPSTSTSTSTSTSLPSVERGGRGPGSSLSSGSTVSVGGRNGGRGRDAGRGGGRSGRGDRGSNTTSAAVESESESNSDSDSRTSDKEEWAARRRRLKEKTSSSNSNSNYAAASVSASAVPEAQTITTSNVASDDSDDDDSNEIAKNLERQLQMKQLEDEKKKNERKRAEREAADAKDASDALALQTAKELELKLKLQIEEDEENEKQRVAANACKAAQALERQLEVTQREEEAENERRRESQLLQSRRETEAARISYEVARIEAEQINRENSERRLRAVVATSLVIGSAAAAGRGVDDGNNDGVIDGVDEENEGAMSEEDEVEEVQSKPIPPPPTIEERKAKISKAIETRYKSLALFDDVLGFFPPLQSIADTELWNNLSCSPHATSPTSWDSPSSSLKLKLNNYKVYAFSASPSDLTTIANFLSTNYEFIAGVSMTAQMSTEPLSQPSLIAPLVDSCDVVPRVFVALQSDSIDDIDIVIPIGAEVVTKVSGSGSADSALHGGVPLNHPLRLFARTPQFTPSSTSNSGVGMTLMEMDAIVIKPHAIKSPKILASLFQRVSDCGLTLVGIRAIFPSLESITTAGKELPSLRTLEAGLTLVMAIRGASASSRFSHILGPSDPVLARRTDPNSIRALLGRGQRENVVRDSPSIGRNGRREVDYFWGGRIGVVPNEAIRDEKFTEITRVGGVGGKWPSKWPSNSNSEANSNDVPFAPSTQTQANQLPIANQSPQMRPAFYICPEPVVSVIVTLKQSSSSSSSSSSFKLSDVGYALEFIVGRGGFKVTGVIMIGAEDEDEDEDDGVKIKCRGEGGVRVLKMLLAEFDDVTIDIDSDNNDNNNTNVLPDEEHSAIALGCGPPAPIHALFKSDIDDVIIVVITPDSFQRDFTNADVAVGTIASMVLTPFTLTADLNSNSSATYVSTPQPPLKKEMHRSKAKCVYNAKLLGVKMLTSLSSTLATAISSATTTNKTDKNLLSSSLTNNTSPCLVMALAGSSGYSSALISRIGPNGDLAGGSLAARASFNSDCIRATYAGDGGAAEPAIVFSRGRDEAYKLVCRLFEFDEIRGLPMHIHNRANANANVDVDVDALKHPMLSLFPSTLPPELVLSIVTTVTLVSAVLKRAERSDFGIVALKMLSNSNSKSPSSSSSSSSSSNVHVAILLRRCNGRKHWRTIVGPDDHQEAVKISPTSLIAAYGRDGDLGIHVVPFDEMEGRLVEVFGEDSSVGKFLDASCCSLDNSDNTSERNGDGGDDDKSMNVFMNINILSAPVKNKKRNSYWNVDPTIINSAAIDEYCVKQEGNVDVDVDASSISQGKLEFSRTSIDLNETACIVCTPKLINANGVSKVLEGITKSGYTIVALRLLRFTKKASRDFVEARRKEGRGGGVGASVRLKSDEELMEVLEYDLERCCLVVAVESDNALVRVQGLVSGGCDAASTSTPNNTNTTNSSYGSSISPGIGVPSRRQIGSSSSSLSAAFLLEDGSAGALASRNAKAAAVELPLFFGEIFGKNKIVEKRRGKA